MKNKGFTLIELLVVIAILGLLATIVLVSLNSSRAKSRDVKRKADLRQISVAMQLYFDINNAYPSYAADSCSAAVSGCTGVYPSAISTFISAMPRDPSNDATRYYRVKTSTGLNFCVIAANLENESGAYYASEKGLGTAAAGTISCP